MAESLKQEKVCKKYGAIYFETPLNSKIGISESVKQGVMPIHGLRHNTTEDNSGWYIWAGEYSESDDFFKPLHASHINNWSPMIEKFLGLAPGWRFLVTEGYEDVWFDAKLLED